MSAGALAVARLLWPAFRRILLGLGRWVARELVCEGARALAAVLRAGVRRLRAKRARLHAGRSLQRLWLAGRIRRWKRASVWFEARRGMLRKRVARWLDDKIDNAIPEEAPDESYFLWSCARAA